MDIESYLNSLNLFDDNLSDYLDKNPIISLNIIEDHIYISHHDGTIIIENLEG